MKNIILCSSNPMLVKNLYGILRDEGYNVVTVDHPALAVQKVMFGFYDFVVVDSNPFGLSAEDAIRILKTVAPRMPVVHVGSGSAGEPSMADETPIDLEELKRTIHGIAV